MTAGPPTWTQRDQRLLAAQLDRLHARLAGGDGPPAELVAGRLCGDGSPAGPDEDSRLARLQAIFRLSGFERDLLLWCAGAELDARFPVPTPGAALSTLDDAHWDALAPSGPLRWWRLIELSAGAGLIGRSLHIDERVLHHLVGVACLDPRLDGVARIKPAAGLLTQPQTEVAVEVATALAGPAPHRTVLLDGADGVARERIAGHVADAVGRPLLVVQGDRLPPAGPANAALARLVEREVALLGVLPFVAVPEPDTRAGAVSEPDTTVGAFLEELGCPVVVGAASPAAGLRADIRRAVPSPTVADQRELWRHLIGPAAGAADAASAFRLEVAEIEAIARDLGGQGLRRACRLHTRTALDELADRIEPDAAWDDLVAPQATVQALQDIAGQVGNRAKVYEEWGMAGSSPRGLGVTALFTGDSGTGKTLAAEVLAAQLDLDLYRIDLAAVVSKYIGDTEKNLKRVFDAADASGAVLLFDEADALFGKRSEVRDSHDRYANLEVSYLLQRMETYRGLAILTTNLKSALDRGFLRRIRFVVAFPFPDPPARARIWRLMFPPKVPVAELDWDRLARLQLSGGHIRTVAMSAAFLAAAEDVPVGMAHVLAAARREYAKLEKPLTETEIGGWR